MGRRILLYDSAALCAHDFYLRLGIQEVCMNKVLIKGITIGLLIAVLLVSIPCAAIDSSQLSRYITTNTYVSGDAVVNETTSIRWSSISGGVEEKMEWSSISIREGPLSESWTTNFVVGSGEERINWFFERTGSLGTVSLRDILAQYN
jgi:hypothetical protein